MKVELAKSAGFCFGVSKALDIVYKTIEENKNIPIYTYGPIIHNEEVIRSLEELGVRAVKQEELESIPAGIMIIRSHGVARDVYRQLEARKFRLVDATCPFVKRIHSIVDKESLEGKQILIFGDPLHPEVEGIVGWCNNMPAVICSEEEIYNLHFNMKKEIVAVAQTTFNLNKFNVFVEILKNLGYYINVVNTICNATEDRQEAARELAARADCMIVIGGAHSSNSQKLKEICESECEKTYFIQTLRDLDLSISDSDGLVGITAGASTPNNIIEEVQNYVRNEF